MTLCEDQECAWTRWRACFSGNFFLSLNDLSVNFYLYTDSSPQWRGLELMATPHLAMAILWDLRFSHFVSICICELFMSISYGLAISSLGHTVYCSMKLKPIVSMWLVESCLWVCMHAGTLWLRDAIVAILCFVLFVICLGQGSFHTNIAILSFLIICPCFTVLSRSKLIVSYRSVGFRWSCMWRHVKL